MENVVEKSGPAERFGGAIGRTWARPRQDFEVTYYQRLIAHAADFSADLRVPFAEYPEIILGIDQKQKLMDTLALDRLESSKLSWQELTSGLTSLQKEVSSGRMSSKRHCGLQPGILRDGLS